ncbi:class I SAM-dependent methyltransferase [Jiella avicenniae]|uniref:Class I SAM-dependent methyltransferase n=1 Tax=Jiella avicenniae TaxID=2907202 RepID=A0A9X1P6P6_9HYPH|nr:class I SAM-dependent methyltransferase [Jiella avicenniae]
MTRDDVVNAFVNKFENARYLEIGVASGKTFHNISASRKVAVDPKFQFNVEQAQQDNPHASYFEIPSDAYFAQHVQKDQKFDVIYIDGLHTAEQTLRDLINAVDYLVDDGVIVIDDVSPPNYAAGVARSLEEFRTLREKLGIASAAWMGDVYKLIYFVDTFFQQYDYRIVADNHGQMVLWRDPRQSVTDRRISEVGDVPFATYIMEKGIFPFAPLSEISEAYDGRRRR